MRHPRRLTKMSQTKHKIISGAVDFSLLVLRTSSVHGLSQIAAKRRHPTETVVWIISVICGIYGAAWLCFSTMRRFQENPTVISLERNYQEWNTTFPSATICPSIKIDEENIEDIAQKWFPKADNISEAIKWLESLANASYHSFDDIEESDLNPKFYLDAVLESAFKFHYALSNSNSESAELTKSLTEMGICYSYNSKMATYNDPSYWKQGNWSIVGGHKVFKGNPLEGDIFAQVMEMNTGFRVFIHSPTEVAEVATFSTRQSPIKFYMSIDLTALTTYSTDDTKSLNVLQRKCRFLDESDLAISPAYSYQMCRVNCRRKLAVKLCGCSPYFYRNSGNTKICDVKGMKCLGAHKERLIKLVNGKTKEKCQCLPPCNDINYVIHTESLAPWFLGTNFKYGLVKYPRSRLKRDVFFSFYDLLVQFGGTVGLCLGCSVLSCLEFVYFFTLRLLLFIVNRIRN